jgi:arylamine N-acetyltransferase
VLERWGIARLRPTRESLGRLHQAYLGHVPFENATKLLKSARTGSADSAIRWPVEFWEEHLRWGSGGTCFSSTAGYAFLLRYLGFASRFVFCQLPASEPRAHTALLVTVGKTDVLVDVGYALPMPIPLAARGGIRRTTPYYDIEVRRGTRDEFLVFSEDDRGQRFRYRFTAEPVSEADYRDAWRRTFRPEAPYMRRLALGRFRDGTRYLYKDPAAIFTITRQGEAASPLPDPALPVLSAIFGLPQPLIHAAIGALEGREPRP